MIKFRHDDFISGIPVAPQSSADVKGDRRHIRAERHFLWLAVEKIGESLSRFQQQGVGFGAGRIRPVRVGVVVKQIIADGGGDFARNLRASGAVEVGDRMTIVFSFQSREMCAYFFSCFDHTESLCRSEKKGKSGQSGLTGRFCQEFVWVDWLLNRDQISAEVMELERDVVFVVRGFNVLQNFDGDFFTEFQ